MFAPDVAPDESHWSHALDRWFTWGFVAWLFAVLALKDALGIWQTLAVCSTIAVAVPLLIESRTQPGRSDARSLTVYRDMAPGDSAASDDYTMLIDSAAALLDADDRLRRGEIDKAQHQLIWSEVYHRLPAVVQ